MSMTPEDRARRADALLRDQVLTGAVDDLRREATDRLLSRGTPPEQLSEARHAVWALDAVMARLQSYLDEVVVADRKRGHRP